jgi:ADP-ribose pyrophosphatase
MQPKAGTRATLMQMQDQSAGLNSDDSPPPWKHHSAEVVGEYTMFRVCRTRLQAPRDGAELTFDIAESADGVAVLATTAEGKLILVEQYRPAFRRTFLELPAGVVEEGEDPVEAGLRELREETGYGASAARSIGLMVLNPSWQTTRVHVVVCEGAAPEGPPELDAGEDTRVRLVSPEELREAIQTGKLDTAVTLAALGLRQNS